MDDGRKVGVGGHFGREVRGTMLRPSMVSLAACPEFSECTLDPQILFSLRARSNTFYSRKCWDREMEMNTTGA